MRAQIPEVLFAGILNEREIQVRVAARGLLPFHCYTFRLAVGNDAGDSPISATRPICTPASVPQAPGAPSIGGGAPTD